MNGLFKNLNRLIFLFFTVSFSHNIFSVTELLGEVSIEGRSFSKEGFFDQAEFHSSLSFSPEIYIPIIMFFIILIIAFIIKKFYFKQ